MRWDEMEWSGTEWVEQTRLEQNRIEYSKQTCVYMGTYQTEVVPQISMKGMDYVMVFGKLVHWIEKNKVETLSPAYKDDFQMDKRPTCAW